MYMVVSTYYIVWDQIQSESDSVLLSDSVYFLCWPVLADLLTFSRMSKEIKVVIYTVQVQNKWYLDVWLLNDRLFFGKIVVDFYEEDFQQYTMVRFTNRTCWKWFKKM